MREILFRAKTTKGKWVYGYPTIYDDESINFIVDKLLNSLLPMEYCSVNIEYDTLGQFTGLTDKNGKKIFEGDIVNIVYTDVVIENCLIVYGDYAIGRGDWGRDICSYAFALKFNDNSGFTGLTKENTLEVIGNKWDNPELLGEQQ